LARQQVLREVEAGVSWFGGSASACDPAQGPSTWHASAAMLRKALLAGRIKPRKYELLCLSRGAEAAMSSTILHLEEPVYQPWAKNPFRVLGERVRACARAAA
jgi:hypothetical protein